MRLEFGTGSAPRKCIREAPLCDAEREFDSGDYENVDAYHGDDNGYAWDFDSTAFPSNSINAIYAGHALNYEPPWKTVRILRAWHRILAPEGRIWIAVPNLRWLCQEFCDAKGERAQEVAEMIYAQARSPKERTWDGDMRYLLQKRDDHRGNAQATGFTPYLLCKAMTEAGFFNVETVETPVLACHGMSEIRALAMKLTPTRDGPPQHICSPRCFICNPFAVPLESNKLDIEMDDKMGNRPGVSDDLVPTAGLFEQLHASRR